MKLDLEIDIDINASKIKYICSSAHRRVQADKSRWTISPEEEVACFTDSQTKKFQEGNISWGFKKGVSTLEEIGINEHKEFLKIAKFVDKNSKKIWHGYPADFVRKPQDRPSLDILKLWRNNGAIEKHHIIKIRQGKQCNL